MIANLLLLYFGVRRPLFRSYLTTRLFIARLLATIPYYNIVSTIRLLVYINIETWIAKESTY